MILKLLDQSDSKIFAMRGWALLFSSLCSSPLDPYESDFDLFYCENSCQHIDFSRISSFEAFVSPLLCGFNKSFCQGFWFGVSVFGGICGGRTTVRVVSLMK